MPAEHSPATGGPPSIIQRLCRYLSELSPQPMVAVEGITHVVIYLNPAFARLVGRDRKDLIGRPFAEAVPEGVENGCHSLLDRVFDSGTPEILAEQEHRQVESRPVYWSYSVWAILGDDERPIGVMIQVTDATETALFRGQSVAINEQLIVSVTQQYKLTEEATSLGSRMEERVLERTAELSDALISLERETTKREQVEEARLELLRKLVTIQEEERRRISRELHDVMGQHLTALSLELKLLDDTFLEGSPSHKRLGRILGVMSDVAQEVHRFAVELRPTALDDLGLEKTLIDYLELWSKRTKVRVDFHSNGFDDDWAPSPIETTLYRLLQEALNNVAKHAEATSLSVILEKRDGEVQLVVEDDGRGFDPHAVMNSPTGANRLGLVGMTERVAMVGGTLAIESQTGGPTTIVVRIPL